MKLPDNFPDGWRESRKTPGIYYRTGDYSQAYHLLECEGCGERCLLRAGTRFCSNECRQRALPTAGHPPGSNHPRWKGDDAGYDAKHYRIPWKATSCIFGCDHTHYERAHHLDDEGPPDEYFPACKLCHARFDAAIRAIDESRDHLKCWRPWATDNQWYQVA